MQRREPVKDPWISCGLGETGNRNRTNHGERNNPKIIQKYLVDIKILVKGGPGVSSFENYLRISFSNKKTTSLILKKINNFLLKEINNIVVEK